MMRNAKPLTAVFGSLLLGIALIAGSAAAQSSTPDSTKDSTSQPAQPSQGSQSSQPTQPSAPPQAAPDSKQSTDTRTDVRSETRTERIVETERTKFFGMDPMFALIVGAVVFIVVMLSIVAMTRKTSTTSVETTRRTSI